MSSQSTPHGSKLDSAGLLILGMESLKPGDMMPVSKAAVDAAGSLHDAADRQRYGTALTCAVLYPIVVELVVKHLWEHEHAKTAPFNHNVHSLFVQLSGPTRRDVEALYDECCRAYKSAIDAGQQEHGPGVVAVNMGQPRRSFAVERRSRQEPQVRVDTTRRKRTDRDFLEFHPCMGCTRYVSELRHRTDALGS